MSNTAKIYHALANSNGVGILHIRDVRFPVSINDVKIDSRPEESEISFRCDVLHDDPRVAEARAFAKCMDAVSQYNCSISGSLRTGYTYNQKNYANLNIEKVIFNDPATIVIWKDGTKTVVKASNEPFDPEKGLAMAIVKKAFGNKGNYFNIFKKWIPEDVEEPINFSIPGMSDFSERTAKAFRDMSKKLSNLSVPKIECYTDGTGVTNRRWKIWIKYYNVDGEEVGVGVHTNDYSRKGSAVRRAKQLWGDNSQVKWVVSQTNPFDEDSV